MNEQNNRILIVDDDLSILRVFKKLLEKEGFIVETAETGKEALKKIAKKKYRLCFVDVKLPDMDGTELLLDIAEDPHAIKIIITGYSSEEVQKKAADFGADDFLVKPVKSEELIAKAKERPID
jgi:CheY-like chemotaxis protein